MFTQTLTRGFRDKVLASPLVDLLTGPHGVDRYTELVTPTWTQGDARAKVVAVTRQTPRSVTLTLEPNLAFRGFRAGQHINLLPRDRRPASHPSLFARQRRRGRTHRAHDRIARRRFGVDSPVPPRPTRHDRRAGLGRRRLHPSRRSAAPDPVRLRRQRNHPCDVDAAHIDCAAEGVRPRDRVHPLRAHSAGGVLSRRARRDARRQRAARLHPIIRGRRARRLLRRRPPERSDAVAGRRIRLRSTGARRRRSGALR